MDVGGVVWLLYRWRVCRPAVGRALGPSVMAGSFDAVANDTRERILEALKVVLIRGGAQAVTLDAVAAEALISKGGLLYHFDSKQALFDGLYRQLAERSALIQAADSPEPLSRASRYLHHSTPDSPERKALFRSVLATARSADSGDRAGTAAESAGDPDRGATAALRELVVQWTTPLRNAVADPVLAETIRLVGDGIFYNELLGLPTVDPLILESIIARLLAQVEASDGGDV